MHAVFTEGSDYAAGDFSEADRLVHEHDTENKSGPWFAPEATPETVAHSVNRRIGCTTGRVGGQRIFGELVRHPLGILTH
jgi:hypothetical protein